MARVRRTAPSRIEARKRSHRDNQICARKIPALRTTATPALDKTVRRQREPVPSNPRMVSGSKIVTTQRASSRTPANRKRRTIQASRRTSGNPIPRVKTAATEVVEARRDLVKGANQAGNDSAGQNNAADEGAGKAAEAGNGETSNAPGQKQRAEGQTGSAGNEQGEGSGSRSDPNGSKSGATGEPPAETSDNQDQGTASEQSNSQPGSQGVARGGGLPSDNAASAIDKELEVTPGDEANLEYARRATDLVLEYLKDQQDNPDPELLKELGWTEQELADFVKRWQQLKQAAAEDSAGNRELDNSLRSLGLQPQRDRRRQGTAQNDEVRGLRDSGGQSTPPPAFRDLYNAFKKGAARSEK